MYTRSNSSKSYTAYKQVLSPKIKLNNKKCDWMNEKKRIKKAVYSSFEWMEVPSVFQARQLEHLQNLGGLSLLCCDMYCIFLLVNVVACWYCSLLLVMSILAGVVTDARRFVYVNTDGLLCKYGWFICPKMPSAYNIRFNPCLKRHCNVYMQFI
ncbi:hypothetical protein BDF21DRAFT_449714 [Thamnidium elegans]|nr:hypothetical protein BDF21DRAFT_449714 [Thamnidium elegans]